MEKIYAGIVLYNPELKRLSENIEAIYEQVEKIVLVDNNSKNIEKIEKKYEGMGKIFIIKNNENFGIAKALNQIMEYGEANKWNWVITLDQDSICSPNMRKEYSKYMNKENVGILCPIIIDRNKKKDKQEAESNEFISKVNKCITSGSLTNIDIWRRVGGFDEKMFIDLVDFDYCKRVEKSGYEILQINRVELLHEIGYITEHKIFSFEIYVSNHSAFRKYYMARNILYYAKKNGGIQESIFGCLRIAKLLILVILFENDKYSKIKAITRGGIDGIVLEIKKYN